MEEKGDEKVVSLLKVTDTSSILVTSSSSFGNGDYDIELICLKISGDTLWTKHYGNIGNEFPIKAIKLSDSNILIASNGGVPSTSVWLLKVNLNGDTLWTSLRQQNGGTFADFIETSNGDILVTGNSCSASSGPCFIWLQRLSKNGYLLFDKTIEGNGNNGSSTVITTNDNGILVLGVTENNLLSDIFAIKLSLNGDKIWSKIIGNSTTNERPVAAFSCDDSTVLLAGFSDESGGGKNTFTCLDANGNIKWSKTYGLFFNQYLKKVLRLLDGSFLFISTIAMMGDEYVEIYKIDMHGDSIWANIYGKFSDPNAITNFEDAAQLSNEKILISTSSMGIGNGFYDIYNILIKPNGETIWSKSFGGAGLECYSRFAAFGDTILFACNTQSFGNGEVAKSDVWVFLMNLNEIHTTSISSAKAYKIGTISKSTFGLSFNYGVHGSNSKYLFDFSGKLIRSPGLTRGLRLQIVRY